jgi:hypothetical protein
MEIETLQVGNMGRCNVEKLDQLGGARYSFWNVEG